MYKTHKKHASRDPRAAAWVGLCHLMNAKTVTVFQTSTGIAGTHGTDAGQGWQGSKRTALEHLRVALKLVDTSNSEATDFLNAAVQHAQNLNTPPPTEKEFMTTDSGLCTIVRSPKHLAEDAFFFKQVSADELNEFVLALPGHEWLLES